MWELLRRGMAAAFVIVAIPCIVLVALAIYKWQPVNPIGKGIGALSFRDQSIFLAFDDLLNSTRFDQARRDGGEVVIADPNSCDANAAPLADKLRQFTSGAMKVRVECGDVDSRHFEVDDNLDTINLIDVCVPKCHEIFIYRALPLGPLPIVFQDGYIVE